MKNHQQNIFLPLIVFSFLIFVFKGINAIFPSTPFVVANLHMEGGCSEIGCIELSKNDEVDFRNGSFAIKADIKNIENLFTLYENIQKLEGILSVDSTSSFRVKINPAYREYNVYDEVKRTIGASIEAPIGCFLKDGQYNLKIIYNKLIVGQFSFRTKANSGLYSRFIPRPFLYLYKYINSFVFLFSALMILISYLVEVRAFKRNNDARRLVHHLMLGRCIIFSLIGGYLFFKVARIANEHLLASSFIILSAMPWGLVPAVRSCTANIAELVTRISLVGLSGYRMANNLRQEKTKKKTTKGKSIKKSGQKIFGIVNEERSAYLNFKKVFHDKSPFWLVLAIFVLFIFTSLLSADSSFLWSIFEERDFLIAQEVGSFKYFPTLGPQLIAGGQTPGGFLYIFLAPFAKLIGTPIIFALLNKFLYLLSGCLIWIILNNYVGRIAAFLGAFLFCSSIVVVGSAYWPIHPSMSVFFHLVFLFLVLRGLVDGSRIAIALSGLVLSILVQFHFSYYLLLVAYIVTFLAVKKQSSISRRAFCLSLTLFLLPLIPYIITEVMHGFPNIRLIIDKPRYHPNYAGFGPTTMIGTTTIIARTLEWILSYGSGFTIVDIVRMLLFLIGLLCMACLLMGIWPRETNNRDSLYAMVLLFYLLPLYLSSFSWVWAMAIDIQFLTPQLFFL